MPAMDLARPPLEAGRRADEVLLPLKRDTALGLRVFQRFDAGEMLVDEHRVRQRPQMFGRLELRGMGRQKQQVYILRYTHLGTVMPARTVEHEHDLFGWARPHRVGERVELDREELNADGRRQMPHGPA